MTTLTHNRTVAGLLAALLLVLGLTAAPAQLATDGHVVAQTHALRV